MNPFGESLPILGPDDFGDADEPSSQPSPRDLLPPARRDLLELIETVRDLMPQLLEEADTFAPLAVVMDRDGGVELLPGPDDAEHGLIEMLDEVIRERVAEGTIRAAALVTAVVVRARVDERSHQHEGCGHHAETASTEATAVAIDPQMPDESAMGGTPLSGAADPLRSVEAARLELDHVDDRPFACFLPWFRPANEIVLGEAWLERSQRSFFPGHR
jgi:hypothetical protein